MNSPAPLITFRTAIILAITSLLLGACATQPAPTAMNIPAADATPSREKPVTYAEFHRMMSKLADGPGLVGDRSPASAGALSDSAGFVASNP
jgi:hypothetical protein